MKNTIKLFGFIALVAVIGFSACGNGTTNDPDLRVGFYGTWTRTEGSYQPYTVTITSSSFSFVDNDGDYINYANITWIAAANTATDNPGGSTVIHSNYSNGYTITGTVDETYGTGPVNGFFIAISANGQTLYLGESASVYNIAGFSSTVMTDAVFTKVP